MASSIDVRVPDIGDFEDVEIVEVLVASGDRVAREDSLVTLESDKATMEIPSPRDGVVKSLSVQVGDKVSEGTLLLRLVIDSQDVEVEVVVADSGAAQPSPSASLAAPERVEASPAPIAPPADAPHAPTSMGVHASPLIRAQARELGVDLVLAQGTGPAGRVLAEDLKAYVRGALTGSGGPGPTSAAPIDFSRFGETETVPLSKIQRIAGANLMRSWSTVPHVTQHDEADFTALEDFRRSRSRAAADRGLRLSPLLFVMKAVSVALRSFPSLRSSLAPDGRELIVKHTHHLGVAVDTERGLVVPVVRDVDRKTLFELAGEVAELAERARARKLSPTDMQGACFTISSLGGIGGTAFTPIVNAPEVAVLGVSRMQTRPVWSAGADLSKGEWFPRLFLPLSLSYDHRVIDGAEGARFTTHLRSLLEQPVSLLL